MAFFSLVGPNYFHLDNILFFTSCGWLQSSAARVGPVGPAKNVDQFCLFCSSNFVSTFLFFFFREIFCRKYFFLESFQRNVDVFICQHICLVYPFYELFSNFLPTKNIGHDLKTSQLCTFWGNFSFLEIDNKVGTRVQCYIYPCHVSRTLSGNKWSAQWIPLIRFIWLYFQSFLYS